MKNKSITMLTIACAACVAPANAESTPSAKQLQSYPKNLARQHLASNLALFDTKEQRYVATEAAAAWLDDDVSTGWPAMAGKQHYILQLSEPQVLTNFSLSTVPVEGTVTLYTNDEMKNPGDSSWRVVAKDIPVSSINQKKMAKGFNRQAKYILIETNIENPGPIFSIYAYGPRAAASDLIAKRTAAVDVTQLLGEFVNQQTSFNVSSIYSQGRVTYANGASALVAAHKAIDDNAETSSTLKASTDSGMIVNFGDSRTVSRISMLSDAETKGKVEVFLLAEAPGAGQPVALEGVTPSVTLTFDGTNSRASADFDDTTSVAMALRWTPETAGTDLNVRELNTFANLSLADYEVASAPVAIAEAPAATAQAAATETVSTNSASSKKRENRASDNEAMETIASDGKEILPIAQGKETVDFKGGGKEDIAPVAEGPARAGYFPGGLGFPPNFTSFSGRSPVILVPPGRVNPPVPKVPSP